jgi:hypothetical protein
MQATKKKWITKFFSGGDKEISALLCASLPLKLSVTDFRFVFVERYW